jgi:hypothetical protein
MPLPNDRISVEARRVEMPASPLRATADTMLDEIGLTPTDENGVRRGGLRGDSRSVVEIVQSNILKRLDWALTDCRIPEEQQRPSLLQALRTRRLPGRLRRPR